MYGNLNGNDVLVILDALEKQNKKIKINACCARNSARNLNGKIVRLGIAGIFLGYFIESQIIDLNKRLKKLEEAQVTKDEEVLQEE